MKPALKAWLARLSVIARRRQHLLAAAAVAAMVAFWIACGRLGIDFGFHWDEGYEVTGVRTSIQKLLALPQWYVYGNVYFLVGMGVVVAHSLGFFPQFLAEMRLRQGSSTGGDIENYKSVQSFQRSALELLDSPRYILETRTVFLCLSSLTAIWVYLTLRKLYPGRYLGALAASAFIVFSWELQYHSRFIAMDTLLTQVIAVQLLLLVHAYRTTSRDALLAFYCGAAAAAGLAFSCKAPGLVAILPLGLLPFLLAGPRAIVRRVGLAALGGLIAAVTTVVLQPAIAVDLLRFVAVLRGQSNEYNNDVGHPSFTPGGLDRVIKFFAWLWLAVPSPYPAVALLLSAIVVYGMVRLARQQWRLAALGGVVAGVLFLMMATHPLLIVRQYLMLLPLMAIAFGVGVMTLYDRLGGHVWVRRALLIALAVIFFGNGRWLYAAAVGIRYLTNDQLLKQTTAELLRHPRPLRLSPQLYAELPDRLGSVYRCHPAASGADAGVDWAGAAVVVRAREHPWHANMFGFSRHFFGSREVNYDWYPTWVGRQERSPILILSAAQARAQQLPVGSYGACVPAAKP